MGQHNRVALGLEFFDLDEEVLGDDALRVRKNACEALGRGASGDHRRNRVREMVDCVIPVSAPESTCFSPGI